MRRGTSDDEAQIKDDETQKYEDDTGTKAITHFGTSLRRNLTWGLLDYLQKIFQAIGVC